MNVVANEKKLVVTRNGKTTIESGAVVAQALGLYHRPQSDSWADFFLCELSGGGYAGLIVSNIFKDFKDGVAIEHNMMDVTEIATSSQLSSLEELKGFFGESPLAQALYREIELSGVVIG